MEQDTATAATDRGCEIMASIDRGGDDERLIIAKLCEEEAWLSMPTEATAALERWR
ncbi:MAG: hypothetical protein PPP58_08500 [Natronomonas sp.]